MKLNVILERKNASFIGKLFSNIFYGAATTIHYIDECAEQAVFDIRMIKKDASENVLTITDKFYDEVSKNFIEGHFFLLLNGEVLHDFRGKITLPLIHTAYDVEKFFGHYRAVVIGFLDRFKLPADYIAKYNNVGDNFESVNITLIG